MAGLLFARPHSPLARDEIVSNLNYFHHRSGDHIDFFCAGYGAYWPPGWVPDAEPVATVEGTTWLFSAKLFDDLRKELESVTRWRYGGGAELVLANAVWVESRGSAELDFGSSLAIDLGQAKADGAIQEVDQWFEKVFRYAENSNGRDPTWGFGQQAGLAAAGSGLLGAILSLLPGNIGGEVKKLPHFLVADLRR